MQKEEPGGAQKQPLGELGEVDTVLVDEPGSEQL